MDNNESLNKAFEELEKTDFGKPIVFVQKLLKSSLTIHNADNDPFCYLKFHFTTEKPNFWWRFWQWVLLGWKWEDYKD